MLKTTMLPEAPSDELAPFEIAGRAGIVDLMKRLRRAGTMLTCFIQGGFIPAEARIESVLPDSGALILVAASETENDLLAEAGTITAVGFHDGVKVQFTTTAHGRVAAGVGVRVALPKGVLRLQRRVHGRVKPSRLQPLECMVRGERNVPTLQRLPVLDISVGGVALLGRARDTYVVGQRLANCEFNLDPDSTISVDLVVLNVERAEGSGSWRYGCGFLRIDESDLEKLCTYLERVEMRSAAPRPQGG
jgi:c-di-GMP-binding flagellar brake protein YcgR